MLGTGPLDARTVELLSEAGRYDLRATSNANAETLLSQILDVPTRWGYNRSPGAPLYLLPAFFLMANFWMFGRSTFLPEPILELAKRFEAAPDAGDATQSLLPSGFEEAALSVSRKFSVVVKESEGNPIASSGLEEVVEECRATWGRASSGYRLRVRHRAPAAGTRRPAWADSLARPHPPLVREASVRPVARKGCRMVDGTGARSATGRRPLPLPPDLLDLGGQRGGVRHGRRNGRRARTIA